MNYLLAVTGALYSAAFHSMNFFSMRVNDELLYLSMLLLAFFGLHIALKRICSNQRHHVYFMGLSAGLYTFGTSLNDGFPFFLALCVTHVVISFLVILSFDTSLAKNEFAHAQKIEESNKDIEESD